MNFALMINTRRDGYAPEQVDDRTMTVGELISFLECYDEETPVLFKNDNGYTYGKIIEECFEEESYGNEENEEEYEDDED